MYSKINIRFFRLTLFLVLILVLVQCVQGFNLTLTWVGESNDPYAFYGCSVSSGDINNDGYDDVLVGAYQYHFGNSYPGAVFVYAGGPSGVPSLIKLLRGLTNGGNFGRSVSSGDFNNDGYDDVLLSAPALPLARVYVFYGSPSGIWSSTVANWTASSDQNGNWFGGSVSSGDFNGDGYDDVLVGAYGYDNGETNEGRAYVYYAGPSGISSEANWTFESNQDQGWLGYSVSSGDFNGDGYDDVLVGAPNRGNLVSSLGHVYVFYGSSSGLSSTADWTAESEFNASYYGGSVSSGDINGDGYDDVLVGAHYYYGHVYVYYGGPLGISSEANSIEANQGDLDFGYSVSSGDINGDGYDDVIVGARRYTNGQSYEGRAYVYLGGPSGISSSPAWADESNQARAFLGNSVSSGDINGDDYDDVLAGAYEYDNGEETPQEGRAYIYLYYPPQLPVYSNFISFPHTTNLSAVPDLTNVTNLTLETLYGMLQFPHDHSVNAEGKDLDAHIKFGDCYVSVNLSGLDYTFNATAYLTLNNSDGHCGDDRIYYAPGVYTNADAIRQHDTVCTDCIKLLADNHKVKFRVFHFSSYAIGSNANLTIYDSYENSAAQPNADIIFYANYTNKSGSHISGATCTIYFDGNTADKHNMTDNGNNYNYTSSFSSVGTHNFNITCSATNYNTLSAVDDVEVSSVVPEFSSLVSLIISLLVFILILHIKNKT